MPIKLTDIDHEDHVPAWAHRDPIGVVMIDDDGWAAACPSLDFGEEGVGRPTDLRGDVKWVVGLGYNEVRPIEASQSRGDIRLRGEDWLKPNLHESIAEWGMEGHSRRQRAAMLASLCERIMKISFEAVLKHANTTPNREQIVITSMERSPSLANAFRNAMGAAIDKANPSDKKISGRISDAMKFGAFAVRETRIDDGEMSLVLRVPRLVHALNVLKRPVPSAGKWKKAQLDEKLLSPQTIRDLHELDRPAIISAKVTPKPGLENVFLSSWTVPSGIGYSRISYTLEEATEMLGEYDFIEPHVLVGPGWRESTGGQLLASLIETSGGGAFAHSSWSIGVVAENILLGSMRSARTRTRGEENVISPESVWTAAYDRVSMFPVVQRMEDYGVTVLSGYAGGIRIKMIEDPEMAASVTRGAWDNGLHLQMQTAIKLRNMGIDIASEQESYGGDAAGMLYASMCQKGRQNAFWNIDKINDKPSGERETAFRNYLGL